MTNSIDRENQGEPEKREPHVMTEIEYKPGQENKIARFDSLDQLPIHYGFSYGTESRNMSPVYPGEETVDIVKGRIATFLDDCGMEYKNVANTVGSFEGTHLQMHEVVFEDLTGQLETKFEANFIFTRDPRVVLSIRPGDCNVSILYCKDKRGREIVGLIHSSAMSANMGLPRYAIQHLINEEEVDPSTIRIAITPGISKDNYTLNEDEYTLKGETYSRTIAENNWKQHIDPKDLTLPDNQQRPVDIFGATVMQYVEEGIDPSHIEGYDIDTFKGSADGVTFSHRHSVVNKKPEARYMIAVQLRSEDPAELWGETIVDSAMTREETLRQNPDHPAPSEVLEKQALVNVSYYGFEGKLHQGQIVVEKDLVDDVRQLFELIKKMKFPLQSVIPIADPRFNFDDEKSVYANNVSGFNYRSIAGTQRLSNHALGRAIDLNPFINPYIRSDYRVPVGVDYDPKAVGAITADGEITKLLKKLGWEWGGDWIDRKDYQHFQKLQAQ